MSELDSIVNVAVSLRTQTISRTGFGTPLIMSTEAVTAQTDTAQVYGSVTEMITEGFLAASKTVQMATRLFSQSPRPAQVVVGKRANAPTMTVELTPNVANSTTYSVTISGETFTFTSDASATATEIVDGLVTDINGGSVPVLASNESDVLRIEGADGAGGTATAGVLFNVTGISLAQFSDVADITPDAGIVADVTTVRTAVDGNDDWFAVMLDTHGSPEIAALAASTHIQDEQRMFVASSPDTAILGSGSSDIASTLKTASLKRTNVFYHPEAAAYSPEAAMAGVMLPTTPGSSVWYYKTLAGVPTYYLTTGQKANAIAKYAMVYTTIKNRNLTDGGKSAAGEWLDTERFVAFFVARLQENVFESFVNLPKVPFSREGLGVVESGIRQTILLGLSTGGLTPDIKPILVMPDFSSLTAAQKNSRDLTGVELTVYLAGALRTAGINVTFTT